MSFISEVGGIICLCCVISAAVGIIAPLGNTKKIMNVVMGIFLPYTPFVRIPMPVSDIRIILETDSDHGIYVEEINIYINQEQNRLFRTKINSLIKNDFKVFPNIITVDEGKEA